MLHALKLRNSALCKYFIRLSRNALTKNSDYFSKHY